MEQSELPDGWEWVKLGDVAKYVNGRAFKPTDWEAKGLPIIRIQNLTDPEAIFNYYSKPVEDKFYIQDGDLLISWSATLDTFIWNRGRAILNQHIFRVDEDLSRVDRKYLYYVVRAYLQALKAKTHGTSMQHITRGPFESTEIPLPSLDEQRRIVARIEEFARRATSARGLRQESAKYVDNLMPEARWQVFDELAQNGCERLPLSEVTAYLGRGRATVQGTSNVRLLKTRHVYPDGLRSFDDCRLSEAEAARVQAERLLQPGDVLICSSAAGCLGRPGYFAGYPQPCTTDTHVAIARGDPNRLDPRFLFHYVRSPQGQYELLSREQGGKWQEEKVGFRLTELNLADLRTVPVPLPPLDEQRRIAPYLDALQAKADAIRAAQLETQRELDALMPAVLDRAFRGEL